VRIVAGSAKGTRLASVPAGTRPVSDRAREGVFSSLGGCVEGAAVLDLFAGTGAMGIEALSRGAASAVFVESAPAAVRAIEENLRRTHLEDRATVLRADGARAIRGQGGQFDLLVVDPPYETSAEALGRVLDDIAGQGLTAPSARVIVTRPTRNPTLVIPLHWLAIRRLAYGDALILVFQTP